MDPIARERGAGDPHRDRVGSALLTTRWSIRRQTLFFYEIDADALAPFVAPSLELTEVRPGIGMLTLECLQYRAGHFRPDVPEACEMVVAAMVHPDLSVDMPVPKFALQILRVITDSPVFVEQESRLVSSPMVHVPELRLAFDDSGMSVDAFDGTRPIVSCRNMDATARYASKVMWGLTYTTTRGLQHGIFRWQGEVHEHMKRGSYGPFHRHPVFEGIDTSRVRGCYRQMNARPETDIDIRYYDLGAVRRSPRDAKVAPR